MAVADLIPAIDRNTPITRPSRYASVVGAHHDAYPHFPAAIPAGATHLAFYHYTDQASGDSETSLSYRAAPAEMAALIQSWAPQHEGPRPHCLALHPVAETAQIYVLHDTEKSSPNHPSGAGVAIDPTKGDVMFWDERW